jgi:hypothetical protein
MWPRVIDQTKAGGWAAHLPSLRLLLATGASVLGGWVVLLLTLAHRGRDIEASLPTGWAGPAHIPTLSRPSRNLRWLDPVVVAVWPRRVTESEKGYAQFFETMKKSRCSWPRRG